MLFGLLATMFSASMGVAQTDAVDEPESRDDEFEEATQLLSTASAQFDAHEYPLALQSFRAALALVDEPAIRLNIAVCLERLGRYSEAVLQYEAALSTNRVQGEEAERAGRMLEEVRGQLAHIRVVGPPAGIRIRVEGGAECTLPCELAVDPGARVLVVESDPAQRRQLELSRGEHREVAILVAAEDIDEGNDVVEDESPPRRAASALTYIGAGLAVAGGAGILGFGLRSNTLQDRYFETPSLPLQQDGVRMRNLANVSIGVVALGAVLVAIDLIVRAIRD